MTNWRTRAGFQTVLCITVAGFLMYSVQELAIEKIEKKLSQRKIRPKIFSTFNILRSNEDQKELDKSQKLINTSKNSDDPPVEHDTSKTSNVWVTMGLCWDENAQVHGKENFPYTEAALRSIQLWHKLTAAKVVMQIVHNSHQPSKELLNYKKKLENYGAVVFLYETKESGGLSCVLTSQLVRLLAFQKKIIDPEDIIVTADVDAFIMTPEILSPLKKSFSVWVWRYELSYSTGYTFMMPFIGAKSKTWKKMLWHNGSLSDMVDHYRTLMDLSKDYTWDIDQHIVSHAIIAGRYCSLQRKNKLWKELNLPAQPFDDRKTCWHGRGTNEDCNNALWTRNAMIRFQGGGCKWWHFTPSEGVNEMEEKFREIIGGRANKGLIDQVINGARGLKDTLMDKFISHEAKPTPDPEGELEIWDDHINRL